MSNRMAPVVRARQSVSTGWVVLGWLLATGCGSEPPSPPAISLVRTFATAEVAGSPTTEVEFPRLALGFDSEATIAPPDGSSETGGWRALNDFEAPRIADGRLRTRATGDLAILAVEVPEGELPSELLGALEVELEISAGRRMGVLFLSDEEIDLEELLEEFHADDEELADLVTELEPGKDRTYRFTEADSPFSRSSSFGRIRHLVLVFWGANGAELSLGGIRFVTQAEHLAKTPSGVGWHGLGGVYRETVVARSPERVSWKVELGDRPWLDVAVGSPEPYPATYRIEVTAEGEEPIVMGSHRHRQGHLASPGARPFGTRRQSGGGLPGALLRRGGPDRLLGLARHPPSPRGPLRHRADARARGTLLDRGAARDHLDGRRHSTLGPPGGVGLRAADGTEGSPRLASEGVRLADNISQGSWTKVAVSSILTSLYASTHGIEEIHDRVPASVTTLAEALREAGYTTFHTSSVMFSGRNSNLQQGVEVLYERASLAGLEVNRSKTARAYVDRLIEWLESHHEQPFFAFLHVFDPHSPFRPLEPYDRRWLDEDALARHEENLEKVDEVVDVFHGLPTAEELDKAGVSREDYLAATRAWYDASIRAMDVEVGRLFERLEELGIADDVLFAFVADHGEEFLEHGRSWHGESIYGDMINVPMFLRWPGVVPAGLVVERTTQSIDLLPTLLDLARVPVPAEAQGHSLVPLLATPEDPAAYGRGRAAAFSEISADDEYGVPEAYAVVHEGWKLIWNVELHDERPELELFDHAADPLNLVNLATERPEKVEELKSLIERWRSDAEAARITDEGLAEELSPEELEELRALGYVN